MAARRAAKRALGLFAVLFLLAAGQGDGGTNAVGDGPPTEACGFAGAYPGVPCPDPDTMTLPTGIMPQLPVPRTASGWEGYQPASLPTPAPES